MSVSQSIVFATSNPHKIEEVAAVFAPAGIDVVGLDALNLDVPEPIEDGRTFTDNALIKARYYAKLSGRLILADDSGLCVDALGGEPGVRSARYAGVSGPRSVVDPANNAKMVAQLRDVPEKDRTARFVCVMALCDADKTWAIAQGAIEGRIVLEPRGGNGFGYDPHFFVDEKGCTTAELSPDQKNAISHRGTASRRMIEILRRLK
ncbi:MAG: RdgB/HAM1 family non-canonical purine NTP pyrophosphatase [Planctomycetes bacterium]|nr:RdgB/HAM1 family non-canonical purine NTP pyrophosphatase [Planctomycetota bacterium]